MEFIDEKIAVLQKQAHNARKNNLLNQEKKTKEIIKNDEAELTQEEVTLAIKNGKLERNGEQLLFEQKECFQGRVIIPIIKDFFDTYEEENLMVWERKQKLSIMLSKMESDGEEENIDTIVEKLKDFYKENKIYVEFINAEEKIYGEYKKYLLGSRIPTALDYVYQYGVVVSSLKENIMLIFSCLEKDKIKWEQIIIGIGELMMIK